jgi:lysophospholipase L1-like esterase
MRGSGGYGVSYCQKENSGRPYSVRERNGMTTIIALGDSNTYGFDPCLGSGGRYGDDERWTGIMNRDPALTVIDYGVNGAGIPQSERSVQTVCRLFTNEGADRMIIMLGSNDLLEMEPPSAEQTGQRMDRFLASCFQGKGLQPSQIILAAPPKMRTGTWTSAETVKESEKFGAVYAAVAEKHGLAFADACSWDLPVCFDGVHFTREAHRTFATEMKKCIGNMRAFGKRCLLTISLVMAAAAFMPVRAEAESTALQESLPKYSYGLTAIVPVDGRQGIATDGNYYWVSGTTSLTKYDKNWNVVAVNKTPFDGYRVKVNHFGDIDVYDNDIYVGAEYFMDGVGKNIQIAVYDGDTLQLKNTFPFDADSGQLECSGITVNPDEKKVVMCSWVDGESGRYLYEYSLETGQYLRKIHLQCPPQWLQGITYSDGAYYVTADDGTADEQEADHIYRIVTDPDKTNATVVPEETLDYVAMQGEIEGLDVDPATNQLLVLYNRGSRIVLGMVKGFYPGYDREISEVYICSRCYNNILSGNSSVHGR